MGEEQSSVPKGLTSPSTKALLSEPLIQPEHLDNEQQVHNNLILILLS